VRVVVDGIDGHGLGELAPGPGPPPGHVEGSAEGLTDRTLLRLRQLGLLQDHHGLVRVAGGQEVQPLDQEFVRRFARLSRFHHGLFYTGSVPDVAPFDGLLFDPARAGDLTAVTAPPYDVIGPDEQRRLHRASPHNIALVDLGRDDARSGDKYTRAGRLFRRWRDERVLVPVGRPALYPYEMRFVHHGMPRRVRGVIMEVGLEPWGRGVLPHEHTMTAPVEDRLALMRSTRANISPIYAVCSGPSEPQSELLARAERRPPDRQLADEGGVVHRLWVEDPSQDFAVWHRDRMLLVADGHHRYQTALAFREEADGGQGPGPWDAVMMLVVDAAAEDPPVLPIHRVVRVEPIPELPGQRVRDLAEVLGVRQVRYVPDAAVAEEAVHSGAADLALFLPPARVEEIRAVIDAGGRLPQKSTYFWPKPRTGMVVRPLD